MIRSALRPILAMTVVALAGACGDESDAIGPPNPNGKDEGATCTDNSECKSLGCSAGKCSAVTSAGPSSPTDKKKNGDETDVDCGGSAAPKCALDKGCAKDADCASDACSYAHKCVEMKSCTGHFGGDTCGAGDTGAADAKHESCCATALGTGGLRVAKYHVTAGRMRAFVERWQGNLKKWASSNPKGWTSSWTDQLPASMEEALGALGPNNKRGCNIAARGARTYWQPNIDATEKNDFPQDVLDEKALNCVSWYVAQALCVSDGGRLPTGPELQALKTNNGTTKWPWGNTPSFVVKTQSDQLVHAYSYLTPNPPKDMRTVGNDPFDQSFFIAPPGRRPLGANQAGVMDAMGNMLPWVNDGPGKFYWQASWENHPDTPTTVGTWPPKDSRGGEADGYYAIGARCVYP